MGGSYLSQPKTEKTTSSGRSHSGIEWAMSCMQGWRTSMEDGHICECDIDADTHLFGVFDGHSGSEMAELTELHFVRLLKANAAYQAKDFVTALRETFMAMDEFLLSDEGQLAILALMRKHRPETEKASRKESPGCTANVTLMYKSTLYVANAGDSRCVLSAAGGKSHDLSTDHKPDDEIELNRIKKAGGSVTNGRVNGSLNLSRSFGDLTFKQNESIPAAEQMITALPDIVVHEITAKDEFLLIGCDGIWELHNNQENITFCRKGLGDKVPMTKIAEDFLDWNMAKESTQGYGCDNMSAIIVKLKRNLSIAEAPADPESFGGNGVSDRYIAAGSIADLVVEELAKRCVKGAVIAELCSFADDLIESEASKVFLKDKMKGVAVPTSITLNENTGLNAPVVGQSKATIKAGDLVKIAASVQFLGFSADSAITVVCREAGKGAVVSPAAGGDVIHAGFYAVQAALRTMTVNELTWKTTETIGRVAKVFGCANIAGIRSYSKEKNSSGSTSLFVPSVEELESTERLVEQRYEHNDVFTLHVEVASGAGGIDRSTTETKPVDAITPTVFRVHAEKHLNLNGLKKPIVHLHTKLVEEHKIYPFNLRKYTTEEHLEQAVAEFLKQGVLEGIPVVAVEAGRLIAQFKLTVVITNNGLSLISGKKWSIPAATLEAINSSKALEGELKELLDKDVFKKPKTKKK